MSGAVSDTIDSEPDSEPWVWISEGASSSGDDWRSAETWSCSGRTSWDRSGSGSALGGWTLSGSQQGKSCFTASHALRNKTRTALLFFPFLASSKTSEVRNTSEHRRHVNQRLHMEAEEQVIILETQELK